ncbi:sugar phosphate isomerase/epimerase family protein [Mycolicibacterium sp.]|uniref:sugar phosphate isomerase/epimerase family protein n=1 Tax=Mycolicibacterium sp. TaxID=2320850 RepID=UPI003D101475
MQGRLCEPVGGKIQAFPWREWESEFPAAMALGIHLMEWTLDQERLYENPLMTASGQARIRALQDEYQVAITSLTGDCFMQAPFWKADGDTKASLKADFLAICRACEAIGIRMVVVPLVDNGRLEDARQEDELIAFLLSQQNLLADLGIQVIFESDFKPEHLRRFIGRLAVGQFGINYDSGNSAALGFDPVEEFDAYGCRVLNVHVKDRMFGGTTVPLTTGATKFDVVFDELAKVNYQGNYILQTARAVDADHASALGNYHEMTMQWIRQSGVAVVN